MGAIIARSPVLATDKKASLIAETLGTDVAKAVVDGFGWHVKPLPVLVGDGPHTPVYVYEDTAREVAAHAPAGV